jgi:hypothetical protein
MSIVFKNLNGRGYQRLIFPFFKEFEAEDEAGRPSLALTAPITLGHWNDGWEGQFRQNGGKLRPRLIL